MWTRVCECVDFAASCVDRLHEFVQKTERGRGSHASSRPDRTNTDNKQERPPGGWTPPTFFFKNVVHAILQPNFKFIINGKLSPSLEYIFKRFFKTFSTNFPSVYIFKSLHIVPARLGVKFLQEHFCILSELDSVFLIHCILSQVVSFLAIPLSGFLCLFGTRLGLAPMGKKRNAVLKTSSLNLFYFYYWKVFYSALTKFYKSPRDLPAVQKILKHFRVTINRCKLSSINVCHQ